MQLAMEQSRRRWVDHFHFRKVGTFDWICFLQRATIYQLTNMQTLKNNETINCDPLQTDTYYVFVLMSFELTEVLHTDSSCSDRRRLRLSEHISSKLGLPIAIYKLKVHGSCVHVTGCIVCCLLVQTSDTVQHKPEC